MFVAVVVVVVGFVVVVVGSPVVLLAVPFGSVAMLAIICSCSLLMSISVEAEIVKFSSYFFV